MLKWFGGKVANSGKQRIISCYIWRMPGSAYGVLLRLSTFGESHGRAIGGILEGMPAGVPVDEEQLAREMARRRPGQSDITTARDEKDRVEILSGVFEGKTTGTPIGFIIVNSDQRSKDYDSLKDVFRPSHADYTYSEKYGVRDHRGGGRSSARETAVRVAAAAIVRPMLEAQGIQVRAFVSAVGEKEIEHGIEPDFEFGESHPTKCPHEPTAIEMERLIAAAKDEGDSLGGVISCIATGVPAGLGEPVFDKLHADLGKAMLSINAVKGFEYGSGFAGSRMRGSEHNDPFVSEGKAVATRTNYSGGVQGGISNGQPIEMRVAFKPVATINKKQETVDKKGEKVDLSAKGRHDPCVVPRAVPIVEAMCILTLADHWLRNKTSRIDS